MKTLIVIMMFLISIPGMLLAQDTIYTRKHEELKVKVLEIRSTEVSFRYFNNLTGPVYVFNKNEIQRIHLENGEQLVFEIDPYLLSNQDKAIIQKNNAFKIEFFAPLNGNFTLCYEHSIKVGLNLETKLGLIGFGVQNNNENASGAFLKAGLKMLPGKDVVNDNMKYAHQLRGFYIKPELILTVYKAEREYYIYTPTNPFGVYDKSDVSVTAGALNIVFGKQMILANVMTLDVYAGIGYGFADEKVENKVEGVFYDLPTYYYSHIQAGQDTPLVISGGLTVGFIF